MKPTEQETCEVDACVDCLMLIANGETPPEMGEDETENWEAGIERNWPNSEGWNLAVGSDDEPHFSWSACGVCGSSLGGDRETVTAWRTVAAEEYLSAMVSGYVSCALWAGLNYSSPDDEPTPMEDDYSADDITPEALETIREECRQFIVSEALDLEGIDGEQAGHDFHLTRNGHGAGFWDRGLSERGERLAAAARVWGTSELYAGDDGRLYFGG